MFPRKTAASVGLLTALISFLALTPVPAFAQSKWFPPLGRADLSILKTVSASTVNANDVFTYTLTLKNNSSVSTVKAVIRDVVPAVLTILEAPNCVIAGPNVVCTIDTVAPNSSQNRTIKVQAKNYHALCVPSVVNTATVTSILDPNPANNTSSATVEIKCPSTDADISLTKTSSVAEPRPGENFTYTLNIENTGTTTIAKNVTLFDPLPNGLTVVSAPGCTILAGRLVFCHIGSIPPAGSVTRTITVTVPNNQNLCGKVFINTANAHSNNDVNKANNTSSSAVAIACEPDPELLVVVKSIGTTDVAVSNQKDINLLRFEAEAKHGDVLFTKGAFAAQAGTLVNGQNYTLWVDSDQNGDVDTRIANGIASVNERLTFDGDNIAGGGFVLPEDELYVFEVHADVAASPVSSELQLQFDTAFANYVEAEEYADGSSLSGISTNGICPGSTCSISVATVDSKVWNLKQQGSLFVTKSATLRSHQLLGGTLGNAVLSLAFRAEDEDIEVTDLQLTGVGVTSGGPQDILRSVDRLELYKNGEISPFAMATRGGCSSDLVPADTFCANMESRQLVVLRGETTTVSVRPRIKTDEQGGERNDFFALTVSGRAVSNNTTGEGAVRARGDSSQNSLLANNGDVLATGEVFIGTASAAPNQDIAGNPNQTVLAKIVSIENVNPDADGSVIPTGMGKAIAQFRFGAATNNNTLNGRNKAILDDLLFTVETTNVEMRIEGFKLSNKNDPTIKVNCPLLNADGTKQETGLIQNGTFYVYCGSLHNTELDTSIDSGEQSTFVLEGEIVNASISGTSSSSLQVSFGNFDAIELNGTYGVNESHVQWLDMDTDGSAIQWIEYPETVIHSTRYEQ